MQIDPVAKGWLVPFRLLPATLTGLQLGALTSRNDDRQSHVFVDLRRLVVVRSRSVAIRNVVVPGIVDRKKVSAPLQLLGFGTCLAEARTPSASAEPVRVIQVETKLLE